MNEDQEQKLVTEAGTPLVVDEAALEQIVALIEERVIENLTRAIERIVQERG